MLTVLLYYLKNVISKCSQKLLNHAKQPGTDALTTAFKNSSSKNCKATGDLIGNKTAYKITKVSKSSPHNN